MTIALLKGVDDAHLNIAFVFTLPTMLVLGTKRFLKQVLVEPREPCLLPPSFLRIVPFGLALLFEGVCPNGSKRNPKSTQGQEKGGRTTFKGEQRITKLSTCN